MLSRAGAVHEQLPVSTISGWGVGCLLQIRRWARRFALDIVNLQYQTAAFNMSPLYSFLASGDSIGVPLVTTFHDLRHPYLFPKAGRLRDWIVMRLARASRGIIATNHEDEESAAVPPGPSAASFPIGSSIPSAERSPHQTRRGLSAERPRNTSSLLLGHFGFVRRGQRHGILDRGAGDAYGKRRARSAAPFHRRKRSNRCRYRSGQPIILRALDETASSQHRARRRR